MTFKALKQLEYSKRIKKNSTTFWDVLFSHERDTVLKFWKYDKDVYVFATHEKHIEEEEVFSVRHGLKHFVGSFFVTWDGYLLDLSEGKSDCDNINY